MAFDGIITRQVVRELNTCLLNGKITKVFQPSKNEVLLGVYSNGTNYALLINIDAHSCRFHLTTTQKPNPFNAPGFCMLLRKHLIGMRIKSITTYDLERVVDIELEGFDELNDLTTKKIVIELMGKHSNIILLSSSQKIIDSLRHLDSLSNSTRDILPTREYIFPTTDKMSFMEISSFEEFLEKIQSYISNTNTFSIDSLFSNNFIGISQLLMQSILKRLDISPNSNVEADLKQVYESLKELVASSSLACILYENKTKQDYIIQIDENASSLCVNFFLDDYYSTKEDSDTFINYRNNLLKLILGELKKYNKRLINMNKKLEECTKMDQYRLYGELITANLYQIDSSKNTDSIVLNNYYDNNTPITIPLDNTISTNLNAKKYFKKYNKLKSACEIVTVQKYDTKKEINYIESVIYELESASTIQEINSIYTEVSESFLLKNHTKLSTKAGKKKKNQKSKKQVETFDPIKFLIDGYTVLVGKNNKQNDHLTLKYAHSNDLWFHTKDIHGSHVILKTNGEEVSEDLINQCATIASYYSKAKNSSNVPVDYTFIRYVKKPSGSKPGMVIYTNQTTVNVNPSNFKFEPENTSIPFDE